MLSRCLFGCYYVNEGSNAVCQSVFRGCWSLNVFRDVGVWLFFGGVGVQSWVIVVFECNIEVIVVFEYNIGVII